MITALYKVKLKSDIGIHYVSAVATSYQDAIIIIMNAEGCPERAIEQIIRVKIISE